MLQHLLFQSGHSSKFWPGWSLLNFHDLTGFTLDWKFQFVIQLKNICCGTYFSKVVTHPSSDQVDRCLTFALSMAWLKNHFVYCRDCYIIFTNPFWKGQKNKNNRFWFQGLIFFFFISPSQRNISSESTWYLWSTFIFISLTLLSFFIITSLPFDCLLRIKTKIKSNWNYFKK